MYQLPKWLPNSTQINRAEYVSFSVAPDGHLGWLLHHRTFDEAKTDLVQMGHTAILIIPAGIWRQVGDIVVKYRDHFIGCELENRSVTGRVECKFIFDQPFDDVEGMQFLNLQNHAYIRTSWFAPTYFHKVK